MKLNELVKLNARSKKRLGRGLSSGKGKTAGRGTKGQKARGKIPAGFTGGLPLYKKLPLKRGKGNHKFSKPTILVNLTQLNVFKDKDVVGIEKLVEAKLISEKDARRGVKILGNGEIEKALIIRLPLSASARAKIEKAGGQVEENE